MCEANSVEMEQHFSLSWNNFHGNLTRGFAGLLGNAEFVDVTIAVEGHILQAHKVILSICSPYFKKMFQSNPCQHPIVVLRDVSHKAMKDLLQFMYHGEVSVKREDLTGFIGTAEVLQIKGLTNKECEEDEKQTEPPMTKVPLQSNLNSVLKPQMVETVGSIFTEDLTKQTELLKQAQIMQNQLQTLGKLKRKSEDIIQNYQKNIENYNHEKRPKFKDKNQVDNTKSYNEGPTDMTNYQMNEIQNYSHFDGKNDEVLDLKTECDDNDIIVTDPALQEKYNGDNGMVRRDGISSSIDDCDGLNTFLTDLKNMVNGKMHAPQVNGHHRLTTIPQKEDGKKKYPQRSCRYCWKIGKRRDTRFMCGSCEIPLCKSPCFEVHFNEHYILESRLKGNDF